MKILNFLAGPVAYLMTIPFYDAYQEFPFERCLDLLLLERREKFLDSLWRSVVFVNIEIGIKAVLILWHRHPVSLVGEESPLLSRQGSLY